MIRSKVFWKIILILLILNIYPGILSAQESKEYIINTVEGDVNLKFDSIYVQIDTIKCLEGHIYMFRSINDSSYVRINPVTYSTFTCCEDSIYVVNTDTIIKKIRDRKGYIEGTSMYWRHISFGSFEYVFNYVKKENVEYLNMVFDDIIDKLISFQE